MATEPALTKFRWPIVIVVLALLGLAGLIYVVRSCTSMPERAIRASGDAAAKIAERFSQRKITTTFQEYLPQLSSDPGGRLEVASLKMTEKFTEKDELITGWGKLNLGTTVTEITVPATYRYYVRLHDPWQVDVTSNICIVHAPRLHPSQPPAIDTSQMEKKTERGWGPLNAVDQMDQLEKNITPTLSTYASDPRHLALVREECRKNVAQFVRDWLLREQQWRDDRFTAIKVIFADEVQTNAITVPPTLEFKTKN